MVLTIFKKPNIRLILKNQCHKIKQKLPLLFLLILVILFYNITSIGCPIKWFTGISCPSCGITRALFSAFRLNFAEAFRYHPLFIILPCFFAYLILGKRPLLGTEKKEKLLFLCIISLTLAVYFYRLFFCKDSVVFIDFSQSFVVKLFNYCIY